MGLSWSSLPEPARRALREPLVQFALIGLVIFAADRLTAEPEIDPNRIVVDEVVYGELARLYEEAQNEAPTREKMEEMLDVYLTNETLMREARALRLDEGDAMIRERMAQRMRRMMYSGIDVGIPSDAVLRPWFEARRDDYAEPDRISFRVIGLDTSEAEARALAGRLNAADGAARKALLDGIPTLNAFEDRFRHHMVNFFGDAFVDAIEAGETGVWRAIPSPRGWQVAAHDGSEPGRRQTFEEARLQAIQEWQRIETHKAARDALEALRKRYPVERQPVPAELLRAPATEATAADGGGTLETAESAEPVTR